MSKGKETQYKQSSIPTKLHPGPSSYDLAAVHSGKNTNTSVCGLEGGRMTCSTVQRNKTATRIFETSTNDMSKLSALSSVAKSARGLPMYTCSIVNTEKRRSRSSARQPNSAISARRSLFASTPRLDTTSGVGGGNLSNISTINQSTFNTEGALRCWKQDPRRDPRNDREYRATIVNRIRAACFANGRAIDTKALEQPVTNTFFEVFDTLANGVSRVLGGQSASAAISPSAAMSASTSQLTGVGYNTCNSNAAATFSVPSMLPMCNVLPKKNADPKTKKAEMDERTKQVINVLMQLGYPFTVARDLSSVSAAHSWPRLLLALGYLADCFFYSRALNVDRLMFPRSQRVFQDDSVMFDQAGGEDAALSGVDADARSEFEFLSTMYRFFMRDDHEGSAQRKTEYRESVLCRYDESISSLKNQLNQLENELNKLQTESQTLKTYISAAVEHKKGVVAKEQQRNELIAMLEAGEKELASLRNDVNELKQENETYIQRSNNLRATVRNQERAQLNAKHIAEQRVNLERELNSLENARCNIEQQANTVELQISEQARLNAMLSEQYEQAAIEAQIIPSTARFAAGRDFEMKLTYSNVSCCSEVLAGLDQVYVELAEALRRNESERVERERELNLINLELEEINHQEYITQSSIEALDREAVQRRITCVEARETRALELRKLKRELEELECSKATREKAIEAEQNVLLTQAESTLSGQRSQLDSSCNEYRLKREQVEAKRTTLIELMREQRKILEASKRHVESGELQAQIKKWATLPINELPQLIAPTSQSTPVVASESEPQKKD